MFKVYNNKNITMTRGDNGQMPLFINDCTVLHPVPYELQPEDQVYVGVMECNFPFEQAIIRKKYTGNDEKDEHGNLIIYFYPEDTVNLLPGKYQYEIKLVRTINNRQVVTTVITKHDFFIED